jgi:hypothetical protein
VKKLFILVIIILISSFVFGHSEENRKNKAKTNDEIITLKQGRGIKVEDLYGKWVGPENSGYIIIIDDIKKKYNGRYNLFTDNKPDFLVLPATNPDAIHLFKAKIINNQVDINICKFKENSSGSFPVGHEKYTLTILSKNRMKGYVVFIQSDGSENKIFGEWVKK